MRAQTSGPITWGPADFLRGAESRNRYLPAVNSALAFLADFPGGACEVCGLPVRTSKSLTDSRTCVRYCRGCRGRRHNRGAA